MINKLIVNRMRKERMMLLHNRLLFSGNASVDNKLNLINKMLPPKWFSKVKIVVCHEYEFNVIATIYSGANMNCI